MATDNKSIKIPAPLESATTGGYVTTAKDIVDEQQGKSQERINEEAEQKIVAERGRAEAAETALQNGIRGLTQSDIIVGTLPSSGVAGKIYRVPGESSYKDYAWNGSEFTELASYGNGIDDVPKAGSDNLVKSGGVFQFFKPVIGDDGEIPILLQKENSRITYDGTTSGHIQSSSATLYVYDLNPHKGKTLDLTYSYASNAFKWLIVSDYTLIPTTSASSAELANIILKSGGKGYPEGSSHATIVIPNEGGYLVLNALVKTYGIPTVIIEENKSDGLVSDVNSLKERVTTLENTNYLFEKDIANELDTPSEGTVASSQLLYGELYEPMSGLKAIDITSQFSFIDEHGILASTGGISTGNYDTYYSHSPIIELPKNTRKVVVLVPRKPLLSSNIGFAIYSSNAGYGENFITGGKSDSSGSPTATTGAGKLYTQEITLEGLTDNAKYIAASWWSSSNLATHDTDSFICVAYVDGDQQKYFTRKEAEELSTNMVNKTEIQAIDTQLRESYVGINYVSMPSINSNFLKYSSMRVNGPRIGLAPMCQWGFSFQSTALYGKFLFVVSNGENSTRCAIVDVSTMTVLQNRAGMLPQDGTHHNSAVFIAEKYDANDEFPLLLIGGAQDDGTKGAEAYIFRVQYNPTYGYTLTQVSTLHLPLHDDVFGNNSTACNFNMWNGKLLIEYRFTNVSNVQTIRLASFTMPTIGTSNDVQVPISSLIEDWEVGSSFTMQDSYVDGDVMYIGQAYGLMYYNLSTKTTGGTFTLDGTTLKKECESSFVFGNQLFLALATQYNGIMLFDARND